ncbi:MAG: class I SAM-dependent RNA methyltransferase [Clostridia bacterium]|nr:class I SAM-dependent RNA methyltransferase [Clostridia bacterium]
MKITITAPSGLEGVVKRELLSLTRIDAPSYNGKITFEGELETVALLNLKMRTASRVYILIGEFKATDFNELFSGVEDLDFENYIANNAKIQVNVSSFESKLSSIQAIKSVAKKAIFERLENFYKQKQTENGFEHKIEISLRHDYVTVYLNTSGEPLHKRGYRTLNGEAPIKETVASSMLLLSVWNPNKPLIDPFCGSGTIVIEAGMILKNIAPGLYRDFDFLHFNKFDTSFYCKMKQDALSEIKSPEKVTIFGSDIEESQIKLAKYHAKNAGVLDAVSFSVKNACEISSSESYGVIVTNPPYGERLMERQGIVSLYKNFSKAYKSLNEWSLYLITPVSDCERLLGVKATKKRKIYNGKLECTFYSIMGKKPEKTYKKL